MKKCIWIFVLLIFTGMATFAADFEKDVINTSEGELGITFVGHGTLMMEFNGNIIHIDPVNMFADYSTMPDADLVLITHEHGDHLDANALNAIKKDNTTIILTQTCAQSYEDGTIMSNGDTKTVLGIQIEAVPAYNLEQGFHPKGQGNGYVLTFGDTKVYIAGDTEDIPEMAELENIDIAFLPMNKPYTMTPEQVASAARSFSPKILYPYHFGETDTGELVKLLEDEEGIEVRIQNLN